MSGYWEGLCLRADCQLSEHSEGNYRSLDFAAQDVIKGGHYLVSQPIVNISISIEQYSKLLRYLADKELTNSHNLSELFLELEQKFPLIASAIIKNYPGVIDRDEFIDDLKELESVFVEWRYAYEREFLACSPDKLFALAHALRRTLKELHPNLHSCFHAA